VTVAKGLQPPAHAVAQAASAATAAAQRPVHSLAFAASAAGPPAGAAPAGDSAPVGFGAARYDAAARVLTIEGLSYQLACPESLRVSWSGQALGGGGAASMSTAG